MKYSDSDFWWGVGFAVFFLFACAISNFGLLTGRF